MDTGLEHVSNDNLKALVNNLKSGVFMVVEMGPDAFKQTSPKECPPAAAFELNMGLLQIFEAEFLKRRMNYDAFIGPELRAMIDKWLEARD